MKLSITMMVKNESKNLPKCLEAIKPVLNKVDSELIILDTGSSDNTVDIAKCYTDKVYFHPWNNNFADMRNKSISYAKGEWIWILDADEVLEDSYEIIKFFNEGTYKHYKTALIYIKSPLDEVENSNFSVISMPRLFERSEGFKYSGAIHEQPQNNPPFYKLNSTLFHYGYINSDRKLILGKAERNAQILEKELLKEPNNIYYLFHLSKCYYIKQDFKTALKLILKAYEVSKAKDTLKKNLYIFSHLVECYFWNNSYSDVEIACKEGIKLYDKNIDLYYILAKSQLKLRKYKESEAAYKAYLNLVSDKNILKEIKDASIESAYIGVKDSAYADLIRIYWIKNDYEKVLECIKFIENSSIINEVFKQVIDSYIRFNKLKEFKRYYYENISLNNEAIKEFINILEGLLPTYEPTTINEISELFTEGKDLYSKLNHIRIQINNEKFQWNDELSDFIKDNELNKLPYFYGDILYIALRCNKNISELCYNVYDFKLREFSGFIASKYVDFPKVILEYINDLDLKLELNYLRINKTLLHAALVLNKLEDCDYMVLFKNYMFFAMEYLKNIYDKNIIENEQLIYLRDKEELFSLHLIIANKYLDKDNVRYLRALRDAALLYPDLSRGIKLLSSELSNKENNKNEEFEALKISIKDKVNKLVENSELNLAKDLIKEYETIGIEIDVDIFSMKSVIALMENDLPEAEKHLKTALINYPNNFDVLYNTAYAKEIKGELSEALRFYRKSLEVCTNEELTVFLKEKIANLK